MKGTGFYDTGRPVDHRWQNVARDGVMCLTRHNWEALEPLMTPVGRVLLKTFLESLEQQSEWIATARQELAGELARASEIGKMMQRAGLRSYTDKSGCIFVAAESRSEDR